ncbi:pseudouridine synthase [Ancylobacter mangrovi]|uniref:pseudouridine synthase n=1 Tax=Ancylobacter mangrovi TaxID=2972472 RepID=UPI0021616F32|nr:pseudouridine synthase [Ancylobacter mangrovi]MCS0502430.1 pseudouridine synthase [Ancylobacter mangrovi]
MPKTTPPRKGHNRVPRPPRELAPQEPREGERIAKVIARHGLGSRREIEEWILAGRVAVNGEVLDSPARTVTAADAVTVDGAPLPQKERTRLFLYHKPRGVVTTNFDPEGRATLFEILPPGLPRLISVGRLDLNTEGLILLTNDGGLSRVLELPDTGWLRRYRVRAKGAITQDRLDALMEGITVEGVHYGPIEARLDRVQGANSWLTLALREGKNREVRNVLGSLGLEVNRLIRLSYGPFQLGEIAQGAIEEVRTRVLADQLGEALASAAGADFEGPLFDHAGEDEEAPAPPRAGAAGASRTPGLKGGKKARYARTEGEEDRHRRRPIEATEGPERSVTSGLLADRKGRKVLVQRVRATETEPAPEEESPRRAARRPAERHASPYASRPGYEPSHERPNERPSERGNARDNERGGERTFRRRPDREAGAPDEERPFRAPRGEGSRPPRGPSRDRSAAGPRPARPRPRDEREGSDEARPSSYRDRNDRPVRSRPAGEEERPARGNRPFREGGGSDRPFRERPQGERGDRPQGNRPQGDRPARERPYGERSSGERGERSGLHRPYRGEGSDRPFSGRVKSEQHRSRGPRSDEDRPARGDRPFRERPSGDRPSGPRSSGERPSGDRPFRDRGPRPEGLAGGEGREGRPFRSRPEGDRPFRSRDERPERAPRGERPQGRGFDRPSHGEPAEGRAGRTPDSGRPGGKRFGGPSSGGKGPGRGGPGGKGPAGKGPGRGPSKGPAGKGPGKGPGGRPGRPPRG